MIRLAAALLPLASGLQLDDPRPKVKLAGVAASTKSARLAAEAFVAANTDGSDKVTYHHYELMYGPFLAPLLDQPVKVLEIGVENGRSLGLWQRLFPQHELIVGVGYGQGSEVKTEFKREFAPKTQLYTGSQVDAKFLREMKDDLGGAKFDLIVDDGSHIPWHQVFTLEHLFKDFLKEGGMYVIEDVETSYWDAPGAALYGYNVEDAGIGRRGSAVEKLKGVVDTVNRGMLLDPKFSVLHGAVDHLVSHIMFSQNCAILWRKDEEAWDAAGIQENQIENYHLPQFLQKSRKTYTQYKKDHEWDVAGTPSQVTGHFSRARSEVRAGLGELAAALRRLVRR